MTEGTPTEVISMICSSGSFIGFLDSSSAGGMSSRRRSSLT